jgi:hypothetical protein
MTLEQRVERLEAVEAVDRLMSRYGECIDNGYDLAGLEQVLTEDLEWTSNAFGSYGSRDEYLAGQATIAKGVEWAFHTMHPVAIDVHDATAASGTFYLLMLATFLDGESREPIVLSARYDNRFVKEDGRWRCSRMEVEFHQVSRLHEGWVRERFWPSPA